MPRRMPATRTAKGGTVASVLVDTDIFIEHLRGQRELKVGRNTLHYSAITRAELVVAYPTTDLVARLLAPFREHPVDRPVAERAGQIRRDTGTAFPYALIAATALEHGLTLATRNQAAFEKIRGLRLRSLT